MRAQLLLPALGAALIVAPGLLGSAVDLPKRLWVEALVILGWLVVVVEGTVAGSGIAVKATPLAVTRKASLPGTRTERLPPAAPTSRRS
jgi:hypothetical protein